MKKTILITGCRGGIGRDAATTLAKRGHKIIATVHREESISDLQKYSDENNLEFEIFKLDITLRDDREKILGRNIDVLINNAGIGESGSLIEVPLERVRSNFETNVFSTLALSQLAFSEMERKGNGRIIFISSIAGRITMPYWGSYNMTKFSLCAAVNVLRKELKEITNKIHVVSVEPGTYATGFNQKVMNTKWQWMNQSSYFANIKNKIKDREESYFKKLERKTNDSIVKQIIKAIEADTPKERYTAPWWQAMYATIVRVFN